MSSFLRCIFACVAVIICGCSGGDYYDGARINIGSEPQSLDPRKAIDMPAVSAVQNLFEGLMRKNKEGAIEYGLASTVSVSKDRKVYTFTLKKSAWSNGARVTSYDFAYAYKSLLDPKFPSSLSYMLFSIKNGKAIKEGRLLPSSLGIQTPDSDTLIIELEKPCSYFFELLTLPIFFPVMNGIDQNPNWAENAKGFISNGPFSMNKWFHNDFMEIFKNPNYWDRVAVKLKKIRFYMLAPDAEFKLFEAKALDWAGSPLSFFPLDVISSMKKSICKAPCFGTAFLRINVEDPLLSSLKVRRSLSFAIDREQIVEHILQGGQMPAWRLVPSRALSQREEAAFEMDLSSAKVVLSYVFTDRNHLIAQTLQGAWEKAFHLKIVLEALDRKIFYDRVSRGKYQIALASWCADFVDPMSFLEPFKSRECASNNTFWKNEEYARLLEEAQECRDSEKRLSLLSKAEDILLFEAPIIPLYHLNMNYMKNPDLKDVNLSVLGNLDFKTAFFQKEKR